MNCAQVATTTPDRPVPSVLVLTPEERELLSGLVSTYTLQMNQQARRPDVTEAGKAEAERELLVAARITEKLRLGRAR